MDGCGCSADLTCPSGINDTALADACSEKLMTWYNCSIGNSSNNVTCAADFKEVSEYTGPDPTDCATYATAFDNIKLNSTEAKAWQTCIMDGCGCSADACPTGEFESATDVCTACTAAMD